MSALTDTQVTYKSQDVATVGVASSVLWSPDSSIDALVLVNTHASNDVWLSFVAGKAAVVGEGVKLPKSSMLSIEPGEVPRGGIRAIATGAGTAVNVLAASRGRA